MKLFGTRTTVATPAMPREPMTSDPDVLATIWAAWLTAQPLQDQQVLVWRDRDAAHGALAAQVAAEPVRKLRFLLADETLAPEVREIADGLLAGAAKAPVPPRLARAADTSELERMLTTAAVREAVADRMTPAGADAAAFVIALLIGTELGLQDERPRRMLIARGPVFVALRDRDLPIHTWEARVIALGNGTPLAEVGATAA